MSLYLQETVLNNNRLEKPSANFLVAGGFFFNTLFLLAVGGPLLGLLGKWNFFLDILSNFRLQQTVFLVAVCFLLFLAKRWVKFFVALSVLIFCVSSFVFYDGVFRLEETASAHHPPGAPDQLSILLSNVYLRNKDYQKIVSVIEREAPDIAVLDEIDKGWAAFLTQTLGRHYPIFKVVPRDDGYGMAIFSRVHLEGLEQSKFGLAETPSFKCSVQLPAGRLQLWAIHPMSPISQRDWLLRNEEYLGVSWAADHNGGPLVVIGDLNTAPWSPWFGALCGKNLKDGTRGFGIQKSWPAQMPSFVRLPLDHVLVSREVKVSDFKLLEDIGSDHLPILVRVGLREHA